MRRLIRLRRGQLFAGAVCGALLLAYLLLWAEITPLQTGRSDFTNTYVGASLLRAGLGASMYQPALQDPLYLRLVAPLHTGVLPFIDAPLAAVVALPFTFLSLHTAYRVWSLLQLALIAAAGVVAVRAAPRSRLAGSQLAVVALIALSGAGSLMTLVLGQWDGISALGVALLYSWMRQRRMVAAGAALAITSLIAKPHLALGLAAFAVGRRDRRLLAGAAAGTVVCVLLSLLIAGVGGVSGFVGAVLHSVGVWQPSQMISMVGITGVLLGNTAAAHLTGAVSSLALMGVAAALGSAARGAPGRLEAGLAAATALSLLAAPHAYPQDLALLIPAAAWSLTTLWNSRSAPSRLMPMVIAVWFAITAAVYLDVTTKAAVPLGTLTPWALIAAAALASGVCLAQGRRPRGAEVGSDGSGAWSRQAKVLTPG